MGEVCNRLSVMDQTYFRWRKEYGALGRSQAKRLKELERKNARLEKLLANQALDDAILREVANPDS